MPGSFHQSCAEQQCGTSTAAVVRGLVNPLSVRAADCRSTAVSSTREQGIRSAIAMSCPSSRNTARPKSPIAASKSYERPSAQRVTSHHAGTVLEDGLESQTELSQEQYEAAVDVYKNSSGAGSWLDFASVRQALRSLNVRLDDSLFQRLVESRWEGEQGSNRDGVDCDGFIRLYTSVFTPAIVFGKHLRKAAGRGDQELVRELVLRGCNPNTGSGTGETALHTMASFGRVECAKALRAICGKELIMQPRDKAGWTPLMIAAGNGHTPFMRFLLDEDIDPALSSDSGRTALHRAAARGRERALKTLLAKKVKVDCKDKCGYTPLHLAAMHDEEDAMRVLMEAGADVEGRDLLGYTAEHYCNERLWHKLTDGVQRSGRK